MQDNLYPQSPKGLPKDFTNPSKSYKKHILVASAALVLFVFLYFGLSTWFIYKSYKLFANTFKGGQNGFITFISASFLGFLGIFMLKALFFITKRDKTEDIEISAEEEPRLFEFIYTIADELKAPRPHKVFLSSAVNASVFYDISIINLIFPTRKNLEIGLGLVNVLNLTEFKAILAHEFGHFTQKSMLIGRWVYIAHKVTYQIVSKRDGFDAFLNRLSNVDIRIAWIGWLLSIMVWSIRSVSDLFFRFVLITQRALSREMEFHADLVAVSATGSDALINSLFKLSIADQAFEDAIKFVNNQLQDNKVVVDVFAIQSNAIKQKAIVLNDDQYGLAPKPQGIDGSKFIVFKKQMAQAPKMWSTHPSNLDREKNAKRIYVSLEEDVRSSWLLFSNPQIIKEGITQKLYRNLPTEFSKLSNDESISLHSKEFDQHFLLPKYKGAYLRNELYTTFSSAEAVYNFQLTVGHNEKDLFSNLYPESLQSDLTQLNNLEEEIMLLEGLNKKVLNANEGKINYRDTEIQRKDIPEAILKSKSEAQECLKKIILQDQYIRKAHFVAAQNAGNGWSNYLFSLTKMIHYCEHSRKNIEQLSDFFDENLHVSSKMRRINNEKIWPLLDAANELNESIQEVFVKARQVKLNTAIAGRLKVNNFEDLLEEFKLGKAYLENINEWISAMPSWKNVALSTLTRLKEACLDELLISEEYIEQITADKTMVVVEAPEPLSPPPIYSIYNHNEAPKEVTQKLDTLSTFYNSDGIVPMVGRLSVAGILIFLAIFFSSTIGKSTLYIYNGLPIDVKVSLQNKTTIIKTSSFEKILINEEGTVNIKTTTMEGLEIEQLSQKLPDYAKSFVYNISNAAVLYKWTAYYGNFASPGNSSEILGTLKWLDIEADHFFEEPPQSVSLKPGESQTRTVLNVVVGHPTEQVNLISDEEDRKKFINTHVSWANGNSPHIISLLGMASGYEETFVEILKRRLKENSLEIATIRMQQDFLKGSEKDKLCASLKSLYEKSPEDPNLYYLCFRCVSDEASKDSFFLAGNKKWPANPWLSFAAAYTFSQKENWSEALKCFEVAYENAPELREGIVEEMNRINRILNGNTALIKLDETTIPYIKYVDAINNSTQSELGSTSNLYAFKLLADGKLVEALETSKEDTSQYNMILRLSAVSEGASEEIVSKALALSPYAGLTNSTIFPAIALLAQKNRPIAVYQDSYKVINPEDETMIPTFVQLVKQKKIAQADHLLEKLSANLKGKMSLLGVLLIGTDAPTRWKNLSSKLLFINEKPYSKML